MPAVRARELQAVGKEWCADRDVDGESSIEMARYEARERRAAPPRTRHLDAELAVTAGYGGVELGSSDGREGTVRRATILTSIASPVSSRAIVL